MQHTIDYMMSDGTHKHKMIIESKKHEKEFKSYKQISGTKYFRKTQQ